MCSGRAAVLLAVSGATLLAACLWLSPGQQGLQVTVALGQADGGGAQGRPPPGDEPPDEARQRRRALLQERLTAAWQAIEERRHARGVKATSEALGALPGGLDTAGQAAAVLPATGGQKPEEAAAAPGGGTEEGGGALPQAIAGTKTWVFCAAQWQECVCEGKIRWGNAGKYQEVKQKPGQAFVRTECAVGKSGLKDVRPGDNAKHCECSVTVGTPYFDSLNPMLLPKDAPAPGSSRLIGDCDIFREAQKDGPWGQAQWEAAQGFCVFREGVRGGPKALENQALRSLMKVWLDGRFTANYERLYDNTSWLSHAFVCAFSAPPVGNTAAMVQNLIQSVHTFSVRPIIMVNFGMATPVDWVPDRYPRLVVMHAAPLPPSAQRSVTLDKFRAVLLSRVKVGIVMDMDEWAAPRVDNMFDLTEREITKEYPLPILPVHFLDKKPEENSASWWHRFCPTGVPCSLQTTRWGHGHPTWTFWALPFFGRWLRRNLRDEVLFARSDMEDNTKNRLRLADVNGDEDLLNVAIWEESGTKQWCKFDVPDPSEYEALIHSDGRNCKTHCEDIAPDPRFHPDAVPKVFYTACHAINPEASAAIIAKLARKLANGKLPYPVLYRRRFYKDGDELRRAYPSIRCII